MGINLCNVYYKALFLSQKLVSLLVNLCSKVLLCDVKICNNVGWTLLHVTLRTTPCNSIGQSIKSKVSLSPKRCMEFRFVHEFNEYWLPCLYKNFRMSLCSILEYIFSVYLVQVDSCDIDLKLRTWKMFAAV